jgi:hypothetical protein
MELRGEEAEQLMLEMKNEANIQCFIPSRLCHARRSFSLRLGSLVLQGDAAYPHHDAAGVKGLAVLTAHGDDFLHGYRGSCTSSVLTAT